MRSLSKQRQKIWFSKIDEKLDGIDTVIIYSKPTMKRMTVSSTSGTPYEISAGIVPSYDRYITSYDRNFKPEEGVVIWVDVAPELDENGDLSMNDDGVPTVPPDYKLKRLINTQKGTVARYGIVRIGDGE